MRAAKSASAASSAGPGPVSGGSEPSRPPCSASHDHVTYPFCRSERRQTLSPIPASQEPNRSGRCRRSSPSSAWRDASCAASSARSGSPSVRRQSASRSGRWRVSSAAKAALSPSRAAWTNRVSSSRSRSDIAPAARRTLVTTCLLVSRGKQALSYPAGSDSGGPRQDAFDVLRRRGCLLEPLLPQGSQILAGGVLEDGEQVAGCGDAVGVGLGVAAQGAQEGVVADPLADGGEAERGLAVDDGAAGACALAVRDRDVGDLVGAAGEEVEVRPGNVAIEVGLGR